jgi:hypothetical protein
MTRAIEDALGLNAVPMVVEDTSIIPIVTDEQQVTEDVNDVRTNLQDAISVTQQAVQDMLSIAQQSQHPKAYEALNALIKTYADVSMGIADLQIKKQRLQGKKGAEEAQTVNNNLFVGSTAELQKMLEDMKNGTANG